MTAASAVTASVVTMSAPSLPAIKASAIPDIALAAYPYDFDPLGEVMNTLQKANLYLFSITEVPVPVPAPVPAPAVDYYGIFPHFLATGFPITTQYALNAPDYLNQVGNYLLADYDPVAGVLPGAVRALNWAALALPQNIGVFASQLLTGNIYGALTTAQFAVLNPIQYAAYQVLNLGLYELGGVAARAAAVVTAVAEWVPKAIRALADDVTVITNAVFDNIARTFSTAQQFGPLAGLNYLTHSLLGTWGNDRFARENPTIPDALINQTIGEGGFIQKSVQQFQQYVEAPSIRQNLTDLRDAVAEALATGVPAPEPPPFTIQGNYFNPLQSSIPTPWKPTPYVPPTPARALRVATPATPSAEADRNRPTAPAATAAKPVRRAAASR